MEINLITDYCTSRLAACFTGWMGGWALSVLHPCRGLGPLDSTCDANPDDVHDYCSKLCHTLPSENTLYSKHVCACVCVRMCVCIYVCVCVRMCICVCMCVHV